MKTAYELAMERLNKSAPSPKLTEAQKTQLAELDAKYAAKIAEREITLRAEQAKARAQGNEEESAQLEEQLGRERQKLLNELEEKKEPIRQGRAP